MAARRKRVEGVGSLFEDLPEAHASDLKIKVLTSPVHTAGKARFVARYVLLFTQVTRHGTYIDGFAAPQEPEAPESWAAKLVLETRLLRTLHLCDLAKRVGPLDELKRRNPDRDVQVYPGDFNTVVRQILGKVSETEATICLLDQRTTECKWATVEALARHKRERKIELLYFLANGWFGRAVAATTKNEAAFRDWWGRDSWRDLAIRDSYGRARAFVDRFKSDLGYSFAMPFPILGADNRIMYFMIHTSDHPEAPKLARRAYEFGVSRLPPGEQGAFDFTRV